MEHLEAFKSLLFWGVMNTAGIFGFLIGIITIAQISLTSNQRVHEGTSKNTEGSNSRTKRHLVFQEKESEANPLLPTKHEE